jgi:beta-D-galactosyl-(1->4)-L-rhamnose phosphorylase
MAHVLGIDEDTGARVSHGKWKYDITKELGLLPDHCYIKPKKNIYLTDGKAKVLLEKDGQPVLTAYNFGKGKGIYLPSFEVSQENTRLLLNLILYASGEGFGGKYLTDNPLTECAYYPESRTLVVLNNSGTFQKTVIETEYGRKEVSLEPYGNKVFKIQ